MTATATATVTASPVKLRSGAWGAKVEAPVKAGDIVTVRASSGKAWQARVERVVWTDGQISLCATQSLDRPAASSHAGTCVNCGGKLSSFAQRRGFKRCLSCVEGGELYAGGLSYYTRDGRFVLGDDD